MVVQTSCFTRVRTSVCASRRVNTRNACTSSRICFSPLISPSLYLLKWILDKIAKQASAACIPMHNSIFYTSILIIFSIHHAHKPMPANETPIQSLPVAVV